MSQSQTLYGTETSGTNADGEQQNVVACVFAGLRLCGLCFLIRAKVRYISVFTCQFKFSYGKFWSKLPHSTISK